MKKKELFCETYKYLYVALINNLIDTKKYVSNVCLLNNNGFKLYHIKLIEKLIYYLIKINNEAFMMTMIIYMRDIYYKKIMDMCTKKNNKLGTIMCQKKVPILERINLIIESLKKKKEIMNSFNKIELYENISLSICSGYDEEGEANSNLGSKKSISQIENIWKSTNKKEMMERLKLLVELHFDIEQLKKMGVEIKKKSDVELMQYNDVEHFYKMTVFKIMISLNSDIHLCEDYQSVEEIHTVIYDYIINKT